MFVSNLIYMNLNFFIKYYDEKADCIVGFNCDL
jgi:hypothetical protein